MWLLFLFPTLARVMARERNLRNLTLQWQEHEPLRIRKLHSQLLSIDRYNDPKSVSLKDPLVASCAWPSQPTLHDPNPEFIDGYEKLMNGFRSDLEGGYQEMQFSKIFLTHGGNSKEEPYQFPFGVPKMHILYEGKLLVRDTCNHEGCWTPVASAWNDSNSVVDPKLNWVVPDERTEVSRPSDKTVAGDHIFYVGWHNNNYGHFLQDQLPVIAWIKENIDVHIKFLLLYYPLHEEVLNLVDPTFVAERVTWINKFDIVQVSVGFLSVFITQVPSRNLQFIESLRRWLSGATPMRPLNDKRIVLYYSRGGSNDTHHGRIVDSNHENDIIKAIQHAMVRHNRSEELVVFNGQEKGKTMEIRHQFELFRSATAVIGPHGSGLANILWMAPDDYVHPFTNNDEIPCIKGRPKVLEFLLGPGSAHVHPPCFEGCAIQPYSRTYYHLFSSIPWVEYHHILYASNSTRYVTFVSLEAFNSALDYIWAS